MNKNWILFNLREALDSLSRLTVEIETDPEFDDISFGIELDHLYGHLNTAWNSRNAEHEQLVAQSDEDFNAWRAFPSDLPLGSA